MHASSAPPGQRVDDGARVRPAPVALELGDDLHRAHLRRARDGAGREARAQQVEGVTPSRELADDLRDEVRHVREALGLEEARDAHRPRPAHAREVVAPEVDEHHVLGAVLLGGEQPLGVALAGRRRAGDRVQRRRAALALDERLGRGADEREPVELEQEEVRRRVDAPQRAVELERRRRRRPLGALREHDLEGVARRGCAPCARATRALVLACVGEARRVGPRRAGVARRPSARSPRAAPRLAGSPRSTSAMPRDVVEADEHVGDDEAALGQPAPVVRAAGTVGSSCATKS